MNCLRRHLLPTGRWKCFWWEGRGVCRKEWALTCIFRACQGCICISPAECVLSKSLLCLWLCWGLSDSRAWEMLPCRHRVVEVGQNTAAVPTTLAKKKTVDSKSHPCTCCNVAQHLLVLPQVVLTPASLKLGLGFYWENSGLVNLLLPGCEVKWRWLTWLKGHRLQNRMRCEMASETTIMLIWCKWCKKYGMSIKNSGNWNWVEIMWEKHIWGKLCGLVWNYKLICFRCVQGSVPASSGGSGFEMFCMNPWTSFKFSFYEN